MQLMLLFYIPLLFVTILSEFIITKPHSSLITKAICGSRLSMPKTHHSLIHYIFSCQLFHLSPLIFSHQHQHTRKLFSTQGCAFCVRNIYWVYMKHIPGIYTMLILLWRLFLDYFSNKIWRVILVQFYSARFLKLSTRWEFRHGILGFLIQPHIKSYLF